MSTFGPILVLALFYLAIGSVVVVLAAQSEERPVTFWGAVVALWAWPVVAGVAAWRVMSGRPGPWL